MGVSEARLRSLNRGAPVSSTTPDGAPGAEHGLGLRIVRQIVRAHGGRLTVAAVQPHGLRVAVWIGEK